MLGSIANVTTNDLVSAAKFNEIQRQIYQILGPQWMHYGSYVSTPVTTATNISAGAWNNLRSDMNRLYIHQNNARIPVAPASFGERVTATFVNSLIDIANTQYTNSGTVHPLQLKQSNFNSTSTRVSIWNDSIEHHVKYEWVTSADADCFFHMGGYLDVRLDSAGGTNNTDDTIWRDLIVTANTQLSTDPSLRFTPTDWATLGSGAIKGGVGGLAVASYLGEEIRLFYTKTTTQQINVVVQFITDGTRTIDLDVFCSVYEHHSIDDGSVLSSISGGLATRRPDVVTTLDLEGGQGFNEFVPRPAIRVSPASLSFSGYTSSTLAYQTISITNIGNTTTNISTVSGTTNGGVQLGVQWNGPIAISSGTTATLSLNYYGDIGGSFENFVTLTGDMTLGDYNVPTYQTLTYKPYDFTLTPSSYTQTITRGQLYQTPITINNINGTYKTYTATLTGDSGFTLKTPAPLTGPVVVYDPNGLPQGTYNASISVTVNGITKTATVQFVNQIPNSSHLGDWISAPAKDNAIVGMSYYIIVGKRYLTIGLGMGADGSTTLDQGGTSYANAVKLNYAGDSKYRVDNDPSYQCVMQKVTDNTWGSFLKQYGVWVDSVTTKPLNAWMVRTFEFVVPAAKTYRYQFSCDNNGYFDIDGNAVITEQGPSIYASGVSGSKFLTAGTHSVTLHMKNTGAAGGIGLNIYDQSTNASIWSTLDVVSTGAYQYWQEAYRIPILADGTPRTYYNAAYKVKDVGAVNGNSWSSYFGTAGEVSQGSMFKIDDDGQGNLTIGWLASSTRPNVTSLDQTIVGLSFAAYYYADPIIPRYSQLEEIQNGTQTHQFTGFDRVGTVTTTLQDYPGYNNSVPVGSGGGNNDWVAGAVLGAGVELALVEAGLIAIGTSGGVGALLGAAVLKIICTELHAQGKLPDDIFKADQQFGQALLESNPDAYYGYRAWAEVVVDWMQGGGPDMMLWIKDPVDRQKRITAFVNNWTEIIAIPWAEHMAYRMGVREKDNKVGKILMYAGIPISIAVGKWQRWFGKSEKPAGWFKGAAIIGICAVLRTVVAIGNLLGKK